MNKEIYRITFTDEQNKVWTVHAHAIYPSDLFGFVEVEEIYFPDSSDIIINPEDDKARSMFKGVKRLFIPASRIIRIDELFSGEKAPVISIKSAE